MVFSGIDRARFRRPVVPGDQLRIEVDVLNWKPRAARLEGKVYVERKLVCEATIMCQVVPRPPKIVSEASAAPVVAPDATPDLETVNHE
jgi:3-hydroxyacyl-[acyl-carrier-protein] dehydratase